MDELRRKLLHEIMGIYGPNQGQSIGAVIIPAFFSPLLVLLANPNINPVIYKGETKILKLNTSKSEIKPKTSEVIAAPSAFSLF